MPEHRRAPPWLTNPWLPLAVVALVAVFFRLWRIGDIPPGLFGDEATDGLDALDVLAGRGAVFFPANFGREGLHMWLLAASFRLLGVTPFAVRLPSVLAGIGTVLATYWLAWELVHAWLAPSEGKRESPDDPSVVRRAEGPLGVAYFVPLVVSLYVATSYWHVHFSRFGIRGVFTPLCGALAFAALWRGFRRGRFVWFLLSGFFMGLASHFYTAGRFYPLFLGAFLLIQAAIAHAAGQRDPALLRRYFWQIATLYGAAALTFAPLGLYFMQHPDSFLQRAGEIAAFGESDPWARIGRAAIANVFQFFVPGRGDTAQFYNLPGRPVFDLVSAVLAVLGIAALLRFWRRAPALFLLIWFPALLLPSFLATDRFPTLPRVLGVIPGVYFFAGIGATGLAAAIAWVWRNPELPRRSGALPVYLAALAVAAALIFHAAATYRDYFLLWGPSEATYDAFEGDMASAWRWLATAVPKPAGHKYLSSDIYRHPTFMLLQEHATVTDYFTHRDPGLSWFDARAALPLSPPGQSATYLIGSSAPATGFGADLLGKGSALRGAVLAPDGSPALQVIERAATEDPSTSAGLMPSTLPETIPFTDRLTLTGAKLAEAPDGATELRLLWHTTGPDPGEYPGYRLEIQSGDQQTSLPFDAFRPPEWVTDGGFVTWHRLESPVRPPARLQLRLLRAADGSPLATPAAPDGWHTLVVE